jgi:hypothetical protein
MRPVGPGDRLVDEDGDSIRSVVPAPLPWTRREDRKEGFGGELVWNAVTVDPGTYTLVRIIEQARFMLVGFERLFDTWLLVPPPPKPDDPAYVVNADAPHFKVGSGETVYIGTFIGNVISRRTNLKTDEVRKDY